MTVFESSVTSDRKAGGVWTLAGERLVAGDGAVPCVLVPTEAVSLLAVDLPLTNRSKRWEALPFAVEDRIADPLGAVHLALGAELSPKKYLVAVVRHDRMAEWIARADALGLGEAMLVPDALALPTPPDGEWSVDLGPSRAVVRSGDGTGFACPAAMLMAVWEAAGRPQAHAVGVALPEEMVATSAFLAGEGIAARLAMPALDLRQGPYARRRLAGVATWGRRLAWVAGIGALAHAGIAAADTVMLRAIAERRADDTRQLVQLAAPGAPVSDDLAGSATNLLPAPGARGSGGGPFLPLINRVSAALAPVSSDVAVRSIRWNAGALTVEFEPKDGLEQRLGEAMRGARVPAQVTRGGDGAIRLVTS